MKQVLFSILVLGVLSCSDSPESPTNDPFVELGVVRYAEGFSLWQDDRGNYRVDLYNLESVDRELFYQFYLAADSVNAGNNPVLSFPIDSLACLSTTHIALLDRSKALNTLKGVAFASYVKSEKVLEGLSNGTVTDLSGAEDVDLEKLIDLSPDAFLVYPFGDADYTVYEAEHIPCIPFSEYLEEHPLGRAEWMVLTGLMTGHLQEALSVFAKIESNYNRTAELAASMNNSPSVFTGSFSDDTWFAPPGNSLISRFITDANGSYLFEDEIALGNIEFQFEELFDLAYEVDFWGKIVFEQGPLTLDNILEQDERFAELKAFRDGNIFYCNASDKDYFGEGIVEPDKILSDLVAILHPEFLPEHIPAYFQSISP